MTGNGSRGAVAAAPAGFVRLNRSGPEAGGQVGCIFTLAGILLVVGLGVIAGFALNPAGTGDVWVVPVVGGAFALVGGVLLYAGITGTRGLGVPRTEVYVEGGHRLEAGTARRVRLRQPGPVGIDSLTLKVGCDRVYQRRVRPRSTATVEDHEVLWEQTLIDVRDEQVPRGGALEREALIDLPPGALPTGPAAEGGTIRWKLEVYGDVGVMRAIFHPFTLVVGNQADGGDR